MSRNRSSAVYVDDARLAAATVPPDASLRLALRAIDDAGIGVCLVCSDDWTFRGLLTDGDVRRALLGGAELESKLIDFVRTDPLCARPSETRDAVLDAMQARLIDVVPIVDGDRLVGAHTLQELIGSRPLPNLAVVMAGGKGTRLGHLTRDIPKPMLDVAGRPILERIVQKLVGHGIRNIAISVNYLADVITDHFRDGSDFDCSITYLRESADRPLGTGGSLALLDEAGLDPKHPMLVLNGDVITDAPLDDVISFHEQSKADVTVCTTAYDHTIPFGVVDSTPDHLVGRILEKPTHEWTVNAGIYVIEPHMLKYVVREVEYPMVDLVTAGLGDGAKIVAYDLGRRWLDVGRPAELRRARGHDLAGDES